MSKYIIYAFEKYGTFHCIEKDNNLIGKFEDKGQTYTFIKHSKDKQKL